MKEQKYSQDYLMKLLNSDLSTYKRRVSKYDSGEYINKVTNSGITILKFIPTCELHSEGAPVFICRCSCGLLFLAKCNHVMTSIVKSCGSCDRSKYNSSAWIGQGINNTTIINYYVNNNQRYFTVRCNSCGKVFDVNAYAYIQGGSTLCTCMKNLYKRHDYISSKCNLHVLYSTDVNYVLDELIIEGLKYYKTSCKFCGTESFRTTDNLNSAICECLRFRKDRGSYTEDIGSRKDALGKYLSLVGTKQGELYVKSLEIQNNRIKDSYYLCDCSCGSKDIKVSLESVYYSHVHSCSKCKAANNVKYQDCDFIGERFNFLRVDGIKIKEGVTYWICTCERCGKTNVTIPASRVYMGNTKSCGCLLSYQETVITSVLQKHNCSFVPQWSTPDLLGVGGRCLRFDFMCKSKVDGHLVAIEYDGRHHRDKGVYNISNEGFEVILEHDKRKDAYCKSNSIVLYRLSGNSVVTDVLKIIQVECL